MDMTVAQLLALPASDLITPATLRLLETMDTDCVSSLISTAISRAALSTSRTGILP